MNDQLVPSSALEMRKLWLKVVEGHLWKLDQSVPEFASYVSYPLILYAGLFMHLLMLNPFLEEGNA